MSKTRDRAREARDHAGEKISEAGRRLRERSLAMISSRKREAGDHFEEIGAAVHDAANRLRDEGNDNVADWFEIVAEKVDETAGIIRDRDLRQLRSGLERAARDRPGFFLGSLFIGGLAVARFLKASPPENEWSADRNPRHEEEPFSGGYSSSAPASSKGGTETS